MRAEFSVSMSKVGEDYEAGVGTLCTQSDVRVRGMMRTILGKCYNYKATNSQTLELSVF